MSGARRGLTVIELLIALAILGIVITKVSMVFDAASRASADAGYAMALEEQAERVLDQISYAILGCDRDTLMPDPQAPIWDTGVRYQYSLGVDADGEVIWSEVEEVAMNSDTSQVVWRQNPDAPEERRVAWCNVVRPFLEGEVANGVDDNGNGLVDESGLSFTMDRDAVRIRLSLERTSSSGKTYTETVATTVTLRN